MPTCFPCGLQLPSIASLHCHFKVIHNLRPNDSDFGFVCAEGDGCVSTYLGWKAYRVHLLKHHGCPQISNNPLTNPSPETRSSDSDVGPVQCEVENPDPNASPQTHARTSLDVSGVLEDMVLEFAAKMYANHKMPRSHVVDVMTTVSHFLSAAVGLLIPGINETILSCVKEEACVKVEKQLELLSAAFSKLSTEHNYIKALRARDLFIDSKTYSIGASVRIKRKHNIVKRILSNVTAKFIPMRVVLSKIFSLPGVYPSVKSYVATLYARKEAVIENFIQGRLWQSKLKSFEGKVVFPLFLYFDDFEINNPLGSHASVPKLGGVYYSIPCFPPEVRSLLENIFLAGLFYSQDRAEFTNDPTFSEIIKELNYLQSEGITINTDNGEERIFFSLGLVLGDNLGLNQILGFQDGFNAIYSCRFCKTSKYTRQWETTEHRLRTTAGYAQDVMEHNSTNTGVKEQSVWDKVENFETCSNFAVDYLHDGPEGILKRFMGLIVNYYSCVLKETKETFLAIFNDRLLCFDCYGNGLSNRPPGITPEEAKEKTIKMSASEIEALVLIFSMLVGDLISEDDIVWQFYLRIRKLLDVVLAPRLSKGYESLLQVYVSEMYEMYLNVFPNETVPHKLHVFVHYPRILAESGPIVHLSTYRFESKHRNKKTEAAATTCRIDITETLTHKELHYMAYRFILSKGFAPNNKCGKPVKVFNLANLPGFHSFGQRCPSSFLLESCHRLSWITVSGHKYRRGSCVVLRLEGESEVNPTFGIVDCILQDKKSSILLICKTLYTFGFDNRYHAYEVECTNEYECVEINKLLTPSQAIYAKLCDKFYVTVRFTL